MRVYLPDGAPPAGFEPVQGHLEDAYLLLMHDAARVPQAEEEAPALAAGGAA